MGADAEAQTRVADGLQFGGCQSLDVFLPQVYAVGSGVDGGLPVVVDEQQRLCALHGGHGGAHFGLDGLRVGGFKTQLHGGHTGTRHTAHPGGIGQHGIQAKLLRACGKCVGAWMGADAKVGRVAGPVGGVAGACDLR